MKKLTAYRGQRRGEGGRDVIETLNLMLPIDCGLAQAEMAGQLCRGGLERNLR
jgi:hypothetical protein